MVSKTFEDVYVATRELKDLLPRVAELVPMKGATALEQLGEVRSVGAGPKIPWSTPAADLHFEIHASARRWENLLSVRLFGRAKFRGGADELTWPAIERISLWLPMTQESPYRGKVSVLDVEDICREVLSWPRRCRELLGELRPDEEPWVKAPGDLECPYCEQRLELPPGWSSRSEVLATDLVCRGCRDEQGQYLRWPASTWVGLVLIPEDELSEPEAIEAYGLGVSTLRSWVRRGKISACGVRAGRKVFKRQDIEALIADWRSDTSAVGDGQWQ